MMTHDNSDIIDEAVEQLAEYLGSVLTDKKYVNKAAEMTNLFESFESYLKTTFDGDSTPLGSATAHPNDINDISVLDPKLASMVAAVMALPGTQRFDRTTGKHVTDPPMTKGEALHWLTRTPHGTAFARHHAAITKKEEPMTRPEEMQQMRKFITSNPGGMVAVAKRIVEQGGTSLSEAEFTELWITEAGSTAAFAKEFAGPPNWKHLAYGIVRDANYVKTYRKLNVIDIEPVVVGGKDAMAVNDPAEAMKQLNALAEKQHRTFEEVFSDPANRTLAARTYTSHHRPTSSSTSGSELQRR
jgi:hypothetical protein